MPHIWWLLLGASVGVIVMIPVTRLLLRRAPVEVTPVHRRGDASDRRGAARGNRSALPSRF